MYSSFLRQILSTRKRAVATILLWLLVAGALSQVAPTLASVEDTRSANLPPASSDSMQARDLARSAFPGENALPAVIVVQGSAVHPQKVSDVVTDISAALSGPDTPEQVVGVISTATSPERSEGLVSSDGAAQLIVVPIGGNPGEDAFRSAVDDVRDIAADQAGSTQVAVTGPAGISADTAEVFGSGNKTLLLGTILLVLLILLAIYRSPLLALIPLLAAGLAMRLAESTGALMADAGWFAINSQTASIMTVLLFGVGTDYALIITARYREALLEQSDRYAAMHSAMRGIGEAVLSSASTIVLAMFALLAAVSPSLRGFGPYLALGVAAMTLVAFTFIPALILVFGRAVFWPATVTKATARSAGGGWWHTVADVVTNSPRLVAGAVLSLLVILSFGLVNYQQSFDFVSGFRVDTESALGQTLIRDNFPPGEIAPANLLIRTTSDVRDDDVTRLIAGLRQLDDVARVGADPAISDDGHTISFEIVLDHDPYSPEALDAVGPLQASAQTLAERDGLASTTALIGGETAQTADTRTALDRDTAYIVALVLLIVAGVLAILLRSLLAPLYLVGTLVLSFLATMGATTFFTLTVLGDVGIGNRVTAYIFIFLVSLGVDYNIFLMSRYKQEARTAPPRQALHTAVIRTGGVVSSAGLILAATFAVLMTQPIRELFQFGFAMAFGILLDTFVIRPLLVPSIIRVLGNNALWPAKLTLAPSPTTATATATERH